MEFLLEIKMKLIIFINKDSVVPKFILYDRQTLGLFSVWLFEGITLLSLCQKRFSNLRKIFALSCHLPSHLACNYSGTCQVGA